MLNILYYIAGAGTAVVILIVLAYRAMGEW